jgi:hypothetical protein
MSIKINILTDFNGSALKRAQTEFKALETTGQKAGFILKKAMLPAIATLGALAVGAKTAVAAGENVATANARINQINSTMGLFGDETDAVTKKIIKLAESQAVLTGVSNIQIKEQQAQLLSFKNVAKTAKTTNGVFDRTTKAVLDMQAANLGGGNAAIQLGKALEDPIKFVGGLAKAGVIFNKVEKEKIGLLVESGQLLEAQEMILTKVESTIGGTAAATANDTEKMREGFAQVTQSIGMTLLPVLEAVTPFLLGIANWARENPTMFTTIAAALGAIAASIVAINIAMALNPIGLIVVGAIALIGALAVAYQKFEGFRNIVNAVFGALKAGVMLAIENFKMFINVVKTTFNGIASAWNNTLGKIEIKVPNIPGLPGRGETFGIPKIPMLAQGGIVTGPTLAMIGEGSEPEAVIPLSKLGNMGGNTINVNVQGADPQAVVDALRRYMYQNGNIPIRVSG